eukprot:tig00020961_g16653.t1
MMHRNLVNMKEEMDRLRTDNHMLRRQIVKHTGHCTSGISDLEAILPKPVDKGTQTEGQGPAEFERLRLEYLRLRQQLEHERGRMMAMEMDLQRMGQQQLRVMPPPASPFLQFNGPFDFGGHPHSPRDYEYPYGGAALDARTDPYFGVPSRRSSAPNLQPIGPPPPVASEARPAPVIKAPSAPTQPAAPAAPLATPPPPPPPAAPAGPPERDREPFSAETATPPKPPRPAAPAAASGGVLATPPKPPMAGGQQTPPSAQTPPRPAAGPVHRMAAAQPQPPLPAHVVSFLEGKQTTPPSVALFLARDQDPVPANLLQLLEGAWARDGPRKLFNFVPLTFNRAGEWKVAPRLALLVGAAKGPVVEPWERVAVEYIRDKGAPPPRPALPLRPAPGALSGGRLSAEGVPSGVGKERAVLKLATRDGRVPETGANLKAVTRFYELASRALLGGGGDGAAGMGRED